MDKQRNGHKDKRRDNDQQHNTQKTKDQATRTPLKTKGVNSCAREELTNLFH